MINMAWHSSMCYLATSGTEHTNSQKDLPLQHYDLKDYVLRKDLLNKQQLALCQPSDISIIHFKVPQDRNCLYKDIH